jgi:hypothetical protein
MILPSLYAVRFWSGDNIQLKFCFEASEYRIIMSGRSVNNSSVVVSAGAGSSVPQHACSGLPNGVKFAGEESKDKLYEPKHMKKIVRVLTVVAYVFTVSLAAIMLSVYYVFLWNPKDVPHRTARLATPTPVSPPDAACRQSAAASLQEQQKIPGRAIQFARTVCHLSFFRDMSERRSLRHYATS